MNTHLCKSVLINLFNLPPLPNKCEHLKHIQIIFQKLIDAGLKLKESKCDFFKKEIHYWDT